MTALLELEAVSKLFGGGLGGKRDVTVALDNMSLGVEAGYPHIITIAGESGSGKTTTGLLLLGFYTPTSGRVLYKGKNLAELTNREMFDFRKDVQAVFQDPFAVYNPFYKVDNLLSIPIKNFGLAKNRRRARELMEEAMSWVGLRPEETLGRYPHQLSGGQRQRIAVARALLLKPKLLIADEPVSMVDASLRATILKALRQLNQDFDVPILYITHDLTTAYHVSDYILIMYRGSVMEAGDVESVIREPKHPYTQLLVGSIPWPDPDRAWGEMEAVFPKATTYDPTRPGCKFGPRCPFIHEPCSLERPPLFRISDSCAAGCYLYSDNETMERDSLEILFPRKDKEPVDA